MGNVDLAEQRIGEDLVQLGEEAVLVGGGELAQIEVVGFREAEQDLRRHRALVALDQVDIARRNAEAFRDLGLRQAQLLADAPESRADKQLFTGSPAMAASLTLFYDKIDKMTYHDKSRMLHDIID